MIIFGWNFKTNKRFGTLMTRECNLCHKITNWELCKQTTWFTLFFIPVIPYDSNYCLICSYCDGYISLGESDFEKYKTLIETTTLEERDKGKEITMNSNSNSEQPSFFLIAPDGSQEPIYCKGETTIQIKDLKVEYGQKWETPLAEEFCETVRHFLAKYDSDRFIELHPELEGKGMTLEDYDVKKQENLYIIKEHIYSNSFLVQISVINEEEKETLLFEIFDEESNYINSFTAYWYMWKQSNDKLHIYLSDRGGVFLVICENFKINLENNK